VTTADPDAVKEEGIMSEREHTGRSSRSKTAAKQSENAFRRLQTRGERLLHWFPELGKSWVRESEPGIESLLEQIRSLRGQVSRRAQETGRDIEARAERLFADLEKQAVRGLRPLLTRAQVASHAEVGSLEHRIAHLEGRLGSLLDDRSQLTTRILQLERQLGEARVDVSERLREVHLGLAAGDAVHRELAGIHEHLDALSKEQVTRSLELGKLHDRIVRLEMRFGDLLKEQGGQVADHEEMKKRLGALGHEIEESARVLGSAVDQAVESAATVRATAERVTAIAAERARDRAEIEQLVRRTGEIDTLARRTGEIEVLARHEGDLERALRQLELRVGDLTERQTATREDLTGFVAHIRLLETSAAAPVASPLAAPVASPLEPELTVERREGH
jgi:predicted  nucleic acid-binding Zn-ribbon protein